MKRTIRLPTRSHRRGGYILVLLGFLMIVLVGMLGLVIDSGLMLSSHRQAQNAADAAARACALRVQYEERTNGTPAIQAGMSGILQPIAEQYGLTYNQNWNSGSIPAGAAVTVHHPPLSPSPYATDLTGSNGHLAHRYVEVVVAYPVQTWFIQVLGVSRSQLVSSRAVAGYKSVAIPGGGLYVLDPDGSPGLSVGGTNANVTVNASVFDYSLHEGVNGYGDNVGSINKGQPALTVGGGATLIAPAVYVSGGVDVAANYSAPNVGTLNAGNMSPVFDPYFNEGSPLPIPTTANGVVNQDFGSVKVTNNETVVLHPGIYHEIDISGGQVTFQPGIYVLQQTQGGGNVFSVTGGMVSGNGVMFYNTGSDYNPTTGSPDTGDLAVATDYQPTNSDLKGEKFGGISLNGPNVSFTPPTTGPFAKILFYQRRFNTASIMINGGMAAPGGLAGAIYAKWANLNLAGSGTYNFGIVVGTLSVNGNAQINIPEGLSPQQQQVQLVYLVE